MFAYSDPTGTGFLQQAGALQAYREMIEALHQQFHALKNSGFTLREAFDELAAGVAPGTATINWKAFPVTAQATPAGIDGDRFQFQDEYVEWSQIGDGCFPTIGLTSCWSRQPTPPHRATSGIDRQASRAGSRN
jgi:hypothetical protein